MATLTRKQLAEVFPNHELIKAFENIDESTNTTLPTQIAQAQLTANNALDLATGQALGVFEQRERVLSLRQGDGIVVTPDAAGYVFSLDLGFVVNAAKAFLSRTFQVTAESIRYALGYTPAPTDSPNFTGIPTAPTAAAGTNTTQIATTAHVFAERTNAATLTNKTIDLANNTLTATSAQLAAALTDETGTGAAVFGTSPTLTTPKATTTIGVGNATPASGAGVTFPAAQSPSTDANTLDDYEEGTFTPVVEGLTTAGTGTYTQQTGTYTKIGRHVFFNIALGWSAHTGTGNIQITGLPFTATGSAYHFACAVYSDGLSLTASTTLHALVLSSSNNVRLFTNTVGGGAAGLVAMDTFVTDLIISGQYHV